jgi:hypothetical protein
VNTLGDPEPWEEEDTLLPLPGDVEGLPDDWGLYDGEPDEEPPAEG